MIIQLLKVPGRFSFHKKMTLQNTQIFVPEENDFNQTLIKNPYIPNANSKSPLPSIYIHLYSKIFMPLLPNCLITINFSKIFSKDCKPWAYYPKNEVWTLHFGGQIIFSFGPWSEWSDWHPLAIHTAYYQYLFRDNVVLRNTIWIF